MTPRKILISSPISWTFPCLSCVQMLGHLSADEPVRLALFVLSPPFLTKFIYIFLALDVGFRELSLIPLAAGSWGLSDSAPNPVSLLLALLQHVIISVPFLRFDLGQGFRPAPVPHPLLDERRVDAFRLKYLFEFVHRFVLFIGSPVPFKGMLLSEGVLLLLYLFKGLFDLLIHLRE